MLLRLLGVALLVFVAVDAPALADLARRCDGQPGPTSTRGN
ncbi:MAG: hypothetical protein ACR2K2_08860 [Mycobacteriales bacterium]